MGNLKHTIIGYLMAAAIPAVVGSLGTFKIDIGDLIPILGFAAVLYIPSLVFTFLFGAPTFFVLAHYGLVRWWSLLVFGFISGGVIAILIRGGIETHDILLFGSEGAVSAFVFWLVWRLGRDKLNNSN